LQETIDCHVHICPDNLAERNREIIEKFSGITPAYDGSVRQLLQEMKEAKITKAIVNNTVLRPELMSKANNFTAQVVSKSDGTLIGMAWIIPGHPASVMEVQRCKDLGFKGVKMHHSHFKVLPTEARNEEIYEKIVECDLPVLFHCGSNPYTSQDQVQYAVPKNFIPLAKSFPEMKIILGHLAGYQDEPRDAIEAINSSRNVYADLALDPRRGIELGRLFNQVESGKLVFGSDYPINRVSDIQEKMKSAFDEAQLDAICCSNPRSIFSLG
jgi:uncharacterized protein